MAAKTTQTLIVIFEDEVRLAAKMVRAVADMPEGTTNEDYTRAVHRALNACLHALSGAENEGNCLLLGRKPTASPDGKLVSHD